MKVKSEMLEEMKEMKTWTQALSLEVLSKSPYYSQFLFHKAKVKARLQGVPIFNVIQHDYSSVIFDRVFLYNLQKEGAKLKKGLVDSMYKASKNEYHTALYHELLSAHKDKSAIGAQAYNFSLPDTNDVNVRLSDFRGKVVFIDFWFVGCGGCAEYYSKVVSKAEELYHDNPDMIFIAISIDRDKEKWMKGIRSGKFTSPDIINLHTPDGVQNPVIESYAVEGYPHPLVVDRQGKIFNHSKQDLRYKGVEGLRKVLDTALKL